MSNSPQSVSLLKEGNRLGNRWTIKSLVGKGGCGQVYSLAESDPEHGNLVAKCVGLPSNMRKKNTAKERELVNIANSLYYEWLLCRQKFKHLPFVPPGPKEDYGEDLGCRYFIMKQLTYDLSHRPQPSDSVPLATVCDIGLNILSGLQDLHSMGYLFVDVSPSNFMVEKRTNDGKNLFADGLDKLFFVDFGLVEKYTEYMLDNRQRDNTHRVTPAGAPRYTSIAVQQGETPSRRDDLESMGYVLLELCSSSKLPWQQGCSDAEILAIKKETDISELAISVGCPEIGALILRARRTEYYEIPDYSFFRSSLMQMKKRAQHLLPSDEKNPDLASRPSLFASTYSAIFSWFPWFWKSCDPLTSPAKLIPRQFSSPLRSPGGISMSPPNSTDIKKSIARPRCRYGKENTPTRANCKTPPQADCQEEANSRTTDSDGSLKRRRYAMENRADGASSGGKKKIKSKHQEGFESGDYMLAIAARDDQE